MKLAFAKIFSNFQDTTSDFIRTDKIKQTFEI